MTLIAFKNKVLKAHYIYMKIQKVCLRVPPQWLVLIAFFLESVCRSNIIKSMSFIVFQIKARY